MNFGSVRGSVLTRHFGMSKASRLMGPLFQQFTYYAPLYKCIVIL